MFCSFESPVCTWIILFQKYSIDAKRQWIETLDRPSHMVLSPLSVSHIRTDTQTPFSVHSYFISVSPALQGLVTSALARSIRKVSPAQGPPQHSSAHSLHAARLPSIGLLFHPRALHTLRLALSVGCEGITPRFC
ncbi:hypothetical protein CPAR01_09313 [Colletotrichum paranaense]|uniref:Uncharacterized protein n=1 Tax=Colletotrichum paranaense TaxID=1914294 RepID=A0ABQ9SH42_9PEZI|nr:uncharacterized protein CPAR01_09313 [Colletotrichum paranaense]KAK1535771.1 hypothetical protein CPAR01_09313 [Colletotrichum paranaense]